MANRAAIYARVSTDMQRDNYSVPSQIRACIKYAEARGYALVGNQYVDLDTGKDTTTFENALPAFVDDYTSRELSRPGLDAALLFLESMGFDVLIVHALDRLARDPYIRQTIERDFMAHGAKVEYVLGNYEETPEGEVKKDLDATFAKWENAKRVERSNRGKLRKAESGRFVAGIVPFGYRIDRAAPGGLSIFEPEAEIVRTVFALFVEERLSLHQITGELTRRGFKTHHQNDHWAKSSVRRILANSAYAGYFYYNTRKRQGKQLVERDQADWVRIECDPIISPQAFKLAEELLAHNQDYMRKLPRRFYLLSGMVVCADCKKAYVTQTARAGTNRLIHDIPVYRHRKKQGHCCNRSITGRILEPLVWDSVARMLLDPQSLREGYEQMLEEEKQAQERQARHLETLRSAMDKFRQRRTRLQVIYLDPDIGMTKEEFLEQKTAIDEQLKATRSEAEKIEGELQRAPTNADLESLEEMAAKLRRALGQNLDIPPTDKRRVMEMLNLKVIISRSGAMKIEGWFTPECDGLSSTTH